MLSQFSLISKIVFILSVVLSLSACQKVIDIPLEETAQKIVIEGSISNILGDSYILLSKTVSIYGGNSFETISNSSVKVTDKHGVETVFTEDEAEPGRYSHPTFIVSENNTYTLNVLADDKKYTATSESKSFTGIDFLLAGKIKNEGLFQEQGSEPQKDSIYTVGLLFSDNIDEENYYRFNFYRNGERNERLDILNDQIINGNQYLKGFFAAFDSKDTVFVEFINMDKANYTYFSSLSNTSNNGPLSATPANPVSNIDNDALGYFGAYLKDTSTVIVP